MKTIYIFRICILGSEQLLHETRNFDISKLEIRGAIYSDTWRSVLLMEETGVPGENNKPTQMTDKVLYHNVCFVCL
jgi:hypothetical protein